MTLINRIVRLRHPGVLRDFNWPAELPTFGRYNVIYGWNGSGKTTISRMLRALEMRRVPTSGEVTIFLKEANLRGEEFGEATLPIRVFNRDFVTESVFPVGGGEVPPIFVVGKEGVERQKEVEQLKQKLAAASAALDSARSKRRDAEKVVDKHCIDRATVIRETLRSSGSNPYNNYDKASYRQRATKMAADGDKGAHRLSEFDRERLLAQQRGTPKPRLQEISYRLPDFATEAEAVSGLLKKTVVSTVIQLLRDDPALSAWVHQGLGLHRDRATERCLFCEQTLPRERLGRLEAHFSAAYDQFLSDVDEQIANLLAAKAAAEVSLPSPAEFYPDLAGDYQAAKTALQEVLVQRGPLSSHWWRRSGPRRGGPLRALTLTSQFRNWTTRRLIV